ncbi:heme A synthase [Priestia aryabhattai]|uniref:COX15/CtaA family protein n=1 Tax=Bacillaceae TaxID=186817 RepID=UPI000BA0ED7E|nr:MULTISPECIES: heme A synthase [Bacillaceae]MDT2047479.1 heme A synthase [Priestia flexa]OZT12378.1 heme A synthase [Priestia aryabhattai]TDB55220.1 heme A synthase [Bacillus sp. CBEL-1]USY56399.1 heme A synthase [Bacillus sp. 1780r2a1]
MKRGLKGLSVIVTLAMLLILLGGALVTKTGSGDGCGDSWPLCNGELIPSNITFELVIELSHRLVSGASGILVLLLCVWAWIALGHIREVRPLAFISFFFLVLQALIGAAAVMWGQSDAVLALHFGISLISFASVLLLTLIIFEVDKKFDADSVVIGSTMKKHIYGSILYTYVVVYTGALVRHKEASLACPDIPFCSNANNWLPGDINQWIQMGHRTAATLIFVWILIAFIHAFKHYRDQKNIYYSWLIALVLVTLQAISGMLVVVTRLNLGLALAHALIISLLFGVLSYLTLLATRSKKTK